MPTGIYERHLPTDTERFWSKVDKNGPNGCWIWKGGTGGNGYGKFRIGSYTNRTRKTFWSHRVAFALLVGPIPMDRELDHLCRNHSCVNPEHLEAVTHSVNISRGLKSRYNSAKTHCPKGHPYDLLNTHFTNRKRRRCRECARLYAQWRYKVSKEGAKCLN